MIVSASGALSPNPAKAYPYLDAEVTMTVSASFSGASLSHVMYSWGDGTPIQRVVGLVAVHKYSRAGKYKVSATIYDTLGYTRTVTRDLTLTREYLETYVPPEKLTYDRDHVPLDPENPFFVLRRPAGDNAR